jgi:hypothetical protein
MHFDVSRVPTENRDDWALHLFHTQKRYIIQSISINNLVLISDHILLVHGATLNINNLFNVIPHVLKTRRRILYLVLDQQY